MSGLKIENLAHAYDGNMVFDGLSLEVAVGEVVSLLGPSGCGKSTVLRLVSGLEAVQQGSIYRCPQPDTHGQDGCIENISTQQRALQVQPPVSIRCKNSQKYIEKWKSHHHRNGQG